MFCCTPGCYNWVRGEYRPKKICSLQSQQCAFHCSQNGGDLLTAVAVCDTTVVWCTKSISDDARTIIICDKNGVHGFYFARCVNIYLTRCASSGLNVMFIQPQLLRRSFQKARNPTASSHQNAGFSIWVFPNLTGLIPPGPHSGKGRPPPAPDTQLGLIAWALTWDSCSLIVPLLIILPSIWWRMPCDAW